MKKKKNKQIGGSIEILIWGFSVYLSVPGVSVRSCSGALADIFIFLVGYLYWLVC